MKEQSKLYGLFFEQKKLVSTKHKLKAQCDSLILLKNPCNLPNIQDKAAKHGKSSSLGPDSKIRYFHRFDFILTIFLAE